MTITQHEVHTSMMTEVDACLTQAGINFDPGVPHERVATYTLHDAQDTGWMPYKGGGRYRMVFEHSGPIVFHRETRDQRTA